MICCPVVGAYLDDDNGTDSGSVYVFDATTGQELTKLTPADGAQGDEFGCSVAISGDVAIIGTLDDDDNGTDSGSAYLFDTLTGQQITKLLPGGFATGDRFGVSVAISGNTAVVGAFFDNDNGSDSGSAYLFDVTTGQQIAKLLAADGAPHDLFGMCVGISGRVACVGALLNDDNGNASGSAYFFDATTGQQIAKLLPNDGAQGDKFGTCVAISGTTAIVGAMQDGDKGLASGSAYLFDADPTIGTNYCGPANLNSTGRSAVITALGSNIASENKVTLEAAQLPPDKFGYILNSDVREFQAFAFGSQGNLCLGGAIGRHVKQLANSGNVGVLLIQVDLTALPRPNGAHSVFAGETWNFQCWFRDQNPNATSNFTDAVSITFR